MYCLSVGQRWHRRLVDPHTDRSLHLCTPSMSLEVMRVKGPFPPAYLWDYGGINVPSIHTWNVFYLVGAHYHAVLHQTTRVLLKGLWLVLGESYQDVSTIKSLQNLFSTFVQIFVHFQLLKVSQIG